MKITDALLGEHGVLYRLLDYCAENAHGWDLATVRAGAGALEKALASHAGIENELLFQPLEPYFPGGGPLEVMRAEHDEIEGSVGRALTVDDLDEARRLLVVIADLARDHFAKEEQVLFPMAQQFLGDDKLTEIGERWGEQRQVTLA